MEPDPYGHAHIGSGNPAHDKLHPKEVDESVDFTICQICDIEESHDVQWYDILPCRRNEKLVNKIYETAKIVKEGGIFEDLAREVLRNYQRDWLKHTHSCKRHGHIHLCEGCYEKSTPEMLKLQEYGPHKILRVK